MFSRKIFENGCFWKLLLNSTSGRFSRKYSWWSHFSINGYSEQLVCNLTKRGTLLSFFSAEIFKNGWHSPIRGSPRKHSWWNHFSIIATLNSQSVIWPKGGLYHQEIFKKEWLLNFLMPREMLIVFPWLKLNITFSKTISSHLQSLNGTS